VGLCGEYDLQSRRVQRCRVERKSISFSAILALCIFLIFSSFKRIEQPAHSFLRLMVRSQEWRPFELIVFRRSHLISLQLIVVALPLFHNVKIKRRELFAFGFCGRKKCAPEQRQLDLSNIRGSFDITVRLLVARIAASNGCNLRCVDDQKPRAEK
jgi:hypothetical protein